MYYYHLRIKKNNAQWVFAFDLCKEVLVEKVLNPFIRHESFMCNSAIVRFDEIANFSIVQTEIPSTDVLKKTQGKRTLKKLMGSNDSWSIINAKEVFSIGKDVTEELLKDLNTNSSKASEKVIEPVQANMANKAHTVQIKSSIEIDEQTEHARSLLYELENSLRQFVGSKIEEKNGEIDQAFVKCWESAKKKEFLPPRKPLESKLINYSSFEHLRKIITHNNNWDKIFRTYFGRPNGVISRINEVDEIRDTIAHNRILSDFDYKSFITLYNEIMGCIRSASLEQSVVSLELKSVFIQKQNESDSCQEANKQIILLKNSKDITDLLVSNQLLNSIYKSAFNDVKKSFPDAKLSIFSLSVTPFMSSKVYIMLSFYSKETDRIPTYSFFDNCPIVNHNKPDTFRNRKLPLATFSTLPWVESSGWLETLQRIYRKFGPLSESMGSFYNIFAYAGTKGTFWVFNFEDGYSGKDYHYSWSGNPKDEPIRVE
jgi:hypothetical protein